MNWLLLVIFAGLDCDFKLGQLTIEAGSQIDASLMTSKQEMPIEHENGSNLCSPVSLLLALSLSVSRSLTDLLYRLVVVVVVYSICVFVSLSVSVTPVATSAF